MIYSTGEAFRSKGIHPHNVLSHCGWSLCLGLAFIHSTPPPDGPRLQVSNDDKCICFQSTWAYTFSWVHTCVRQHVAMLSNNSPNFTKWCFIYDAQWPGNIKNIYRMILSHDFMHYTASQTVNYGLQPTCGLRWTGSERFWGFRVPYFHSLSSFITTPDMYAENYESFYFHYKVNDQLFYLKIPIHYSISLPYELAPCHSGINLSSLQMMK